MIKIRSLHRWDLTPKEARKIQESLRRKVVLKNRFGKIRLIAGCDMALAEGGQEAFGGVIVYRWPDLAEVERRTNVFAIRFPYVPGLLAFREAPVLLDCLARLEHDPDLLIFDGQGIAHPRGVGIATHMGLILGKPTIGCAKSRLCGSFREPAPERGSWSPLLGEGKEKIGVVLRTRDRVRPIFVSPGHRIDFEMSMSVILGCSDGFRIPKPTREADRLVSRYRFQKCQVHTS